MLVSDEFNFICYLLRVREREKRKREKVAEKVA